MSYGITQDGFNLKRLPEILEDKNNITRQALGENIDLDPQSPDGEINGLISLSDANLWELAEACYNAFDPRSATGKALSKLATFYGINRLGATSSTVTLTITGDFNTVIPAGSLVNDNQGGVDWQTIADVTIPVGLTTTVEAQAVETGKVIGLAGTLTNIVTPIAGWDAVTNLLDAQEGREIESDTELRIRMGLSVANQSSNMIDSIFPAIADIDGVTKLRIYENDTNATDVNGIPAHNIFAVVQGGLNSEIAKTIYREKPSGVPTFGAITEAVNDIQGLPHDINFSRPTEVPVHIEMEISILGEFPSNGINDLKQAFVDWANGDLIQGCSINIGDDVLYSQLYVPANSLGCSYYVTSLKSGIVDPPTGTVDITIGFDSLAVFDINNIDIIVNP